MTECLCQVSCLGKSGGFGTCQTNSLVIITPTSQKLHFYWNLVCWVGLNFLWSCSIPRKRSVQADTLFNLIFSIMRILTWGWSRYKECIKCDASGFRVDFNFRCYQWYSSLSLKPLRCFVHFMPPWCFDISSIFFFFTFTFYQFWSRCEAGSALNVMPVLWYLTQPTSINPLHSLSTSKL